MIDWHARYVQQAAWTRPMRNYLFEQAGLAGAGRVLEVGCGTGAVLSELAGSRAAVHGLDLEAGRLVEAHRHAPAAHLACGDALNLPYPAHTFDLCFCHFLLLWVRNPLQALVAMKAATRPGGFVLALAEPDYAARIDKPEALAALGRRQAEALRQQGADIDLGRRLADLFDRAGLRPIETGVLRSGGERPPTPEEREMEWAVLEADLAGSLPADELGRLRRLDEQAWASGERILSVPTYFAYGRA
jgi:SAM-dependent methyltransferase